MNNKLYHPSQSTEGLGSVSISFDEITIDDISGVLIDLDDTLYRYDPCHEVALTAAYTLCNLGLSWEDYSTHYRAARDDVTKRLHSQGACRSRLFAFQAMCENAGLAQPYFMAYELDQRYWNEFLAVMRPETSAVAFLTRCSERGLPVCVVTDMTAHVQIKKLQQLGIGNLVTQLVTSEEIGAEKPDARMFLEGARKIGVARELTIMLGDSFTKDVRGALSAGIRAGLISLGRDNNS